MQPAPAPLPAINENVCPAGYQVVQDRTTLRNAFHVLDPRGHLIHYKPWPNRAAAICAAKEHKALSPADRRAMEAQVAVDRAEHDAAERGQVSEQQFANRMIGAR